MYALLPVAACSRQRPALSRYCHYCQRVKVDTLNTFACRNPDSPCKRRFCNQCLMTQFGDAPLGDLETHDNGTVKVACR